ncbi:MAG: diguanylate cyclase [Deltaproteobacteria bacterium]|nr:diguanylate cyclase [Deltaproteobacteria bacterium]
MKVLIADDDNVTRLTISKNLQKWGYEILTAENGAQAWQFLQEKDPPRIAILDWMMPEIDGVEICRKLHHSSDSPLIYTILLTTRNEKEDLVYALENGAHNFQSKPISRDELRAHISVGKRLVQADDRIKSYAKEMERLAATDHLTGINNRRHFLEHAEQELRRSQRYKRELSVLMLDIDHFKQINDTHGHAAGDQTLKALAETCLNTLRINDIFGRIGGEEFAALLPETSGPSAMIAAERIRTALEKTAVPCSSTSISFTVSIGVTTLEHTDKNIETIIKRADSALYTAKENGRNQSISM